VTDVPSGAATIEPGQAETAAVPAPEPEPVLRLAAGSPGGIAEQLARLMADPGLLAAHLDRPDRGFLLAPKADDREGLCRLAIVDPTPKRLATARGVVKRGTRWPGRSDVWFSPAPLLGPGGGTVCFLFPGLEADFRPRTADVAAWLGLRPPSNDIDTLGRRARAALDVGRVLAQALGRLGIVPDVVAGHSVGEWNAMVAGGIFVQDDFDALLRATDLDRIQVPGVDYAVFGCPADRVRALMKDRPDVVLSHENATRQTVVCGPPEPVERLMTLLRQDGVICRRLPFRSGFHTPMLEPFLAPFASGVPALPVHAARVPVWSATTGRPFPENPDAVRALCIRHLLEPVRFRGLILALHDAGVRAFIQVGAGQLTGLVDDTLAAREHMTLAANAANRTGLAQLLRLQAGLWAEGRTEALSREPVRPKDPATAAEQLADLGRSDPLAAELSLLMTEVAGAVVAVVAAATAANSSTDPSPADVPAYPHPESLDTVLPISTAAMPYLLDHCLAAQRPGWPDEDDRCPVVPATTMLAHMAAAAELAGPGRRAVEVAGVRFHRWLAASPSLALDVAARPLDGERVHVALGDYAEGVVRLGGESLPGGVSEPWRAEPMERPPALLAHQLYEQRWMFHGPAFQVLTRTLGVSARGIRAILRPTSAPGSLLDGAGQVLGQWVIEHHPESWIAFPASIGRVAFHAPQPAAGTDVECAVRVTGVTDDAITADMRLTGSDGLPLITVTGWHDRRFAGGPQTGAVHRFAGLNTLAEQQSGGWHLLVEPWPDIASREFHLRKYLSGPERAAYRRLTPTAQRSWLLRRVVVKDAVRDWLWDHGHGPLFPAEIEVLDDGPDGRGRVRGRHGLRLPALDVAADANREIGVALVQVSGSGRPARIRVEEGRCPAAADCSDACPVTGPGGRVHTVSWNARRRP
jgi:malonyl CoA-acyl carrier protein transacylase